MGNGWSYGVQDNDLFDKTAYLLSNEDSAFYTSFRRNVAKVVLQEEASGFISQRQQVLLMLENWVKENSIVYDQDSDFPVTVALPQELTFDMNKKTENVVCQTTKPPATLEENILKGMSSNPFSTPDSISNIMTQLRQRLKDDDLLLVVGKYPRAAQWFASQQLNARSDVHTSFEMHVLTREYSQAAEVVGKLAYGDNLLDTKRNRLQEASNLLQASLSVSLPAVLSVKASEMHKLSASRAADSFNHVMTAEMIALLETQQSMERTLQLPTGLLISSSLVETLEKLITLHPVHRQALLLAVDCAFKYALPPRQFWWTLLRVFARTDQWQTLFSLAGPSRPPIGYLPIVQVMLESNNQEIARNLVAYVHERYERDQVLTLLDNYALQLAK